MRWPYILRTIGALILCIGIGLFVPSAYALATGDSSLTALLQAVLVTLVLGLVLFLAFRRHEVPVLHHREGIAIVAIGWGMAGMVGALPFYFSGSCPSFVDAFFESVSGFTTTGASILTDIEAVPKGILLWRSLTHWLGGMGIIVLSLAILPFFGVGGMQLYKAEVPGPVPDKLRPRIRDTAKDLWSVYILFSLIETLLLLLGGMDLFESLCHTFGTMATGGFSTRNASIGHYQSLYIDTVITVFMFLAGINFSLHYLLLTGKPAALWKDPECRFYMGITLFFIGLCTFSIYGERYDDLGSAFRYAAFQVISILTTTGYATADFELWPALPHLILLISMFLGACAGSTGGGMKCMRIILLLKQAYREMMHLIHPKMISPIKFGGKVVSDEVIRSVWGFFLLYLGVFLTASLLLAAMHVDLVTSMAAVAACLGNIGPGIGSVGPTENYAHLHDMAKWLLAVCMLLGRLEIYTIIVLFVPEFWKK
uniref:TrkH family potassium uptake protein n=1 Tax=Desulfatirhabdium butyrativorans TaxID=340467 RepID=A0A7C4RST0_9BACT